MNTVSIDLKQRKGKFRLFMVGAIFMIWMLLLAIINLVGNGFNWSAICFLIFVGIFLIGIAMSLYDYYKKKNPKLTAESDGETIKFYFSHSLGKSNESSRIKLADMKRFYLVKKRTRLMLTELSFEFEPKSGIFKEKIEVFPELLEADDAGIKTILNFVAEVAPEINIGYGGSMLSQLFSK